MQFALSRAHYFTKLVTLIALFGLQLLPVFLFLVIVNGNKPNVTDMFVVISTIVNIVLGLVFSLLNPLVRYTVYDKYSHSIFWTHLVISFVYSLVCAVLLWHVFNDLNGYLFLGIVISFYLGSLFKNASVYLQLVHRHRIIVLYVFSHILFYFYVFVTGSLSMYQVLLADSIIKLFYVFYFFLKTRVLTIYRFYSRLLFLVRTYFLKQFVPVLLLILAGQLDRIFYIESRSINLTGISIMMSVSWLLIVFAQTIGGQFFAKSIRGDVEFDLEFLRNFSFVFVLAFILLFGVVKFVIPAFLNDSLIDLEFYLYYSLGQLLFGFTAVWTYLFYLRPKFLGISLYLAGLPLVIKVFVLLLIESEPKFLLVSSNFFSGLFYALSIIVLLFKSYFGRIGIRLLKILFMTVVVALLFAYSMIFHFSLTLFLFYVVLAMFVIFKNRASLIRTLT